MSFFKDLFSPSIKITPSIDTFVEPTTTIQGKPIGESGTPIRVFKYASDLHLEMRDTNIETMEKLKGIYQFESKPNHRYFLALVGDIASPYIRVENLIQFLTLCSPKYERIFYVMGNHEFYNRSDYSMSEITLELRKICTQFTNVHLLENETFMIDHDYKVVGTTLWTHVDIENQANVQRGLNDYRLIKVGIPQMCGDLIDEKTGRSPTQRITCKDTNQLHDRAINFINNQVFNSRGGNGGNVNCIVLTHHSPQFNDHKNKTFTSHPKYVEMHSTAQAFCTDLSKMLRPPILAFIYGHTHYSTDYSYNGVRVLSNQYGYEFGDDLNECIFNANRYFIL